MGDGFGSVFIYEGSGYNWEKTQQLTPGDGLGKYFGASVDISGDYVIVGAPDYAFFSDEPPGSAYIYKWNGTSWQEDTKLTPANGLINDYYGYDVAIKGVHAVVAAQSTTISGSTEDLPVFVYKLQGGNWVLQQTLVPSGNDGNVRPSVDISDDGEYIILGSPAATANSFTRAGKVFIFKRTGSVWNQVQTLIANAPEDFEYFGNEVKIDGNLIVIGQEKNNLLSGVQEAGAVYTFKLIGSTWTFDGVIASPDPETSGEFGSYLDVDGEHLVVTQTNNFCSPSTTLDPMVYLFIRENDNWKLESRIRPSTYNSNTSTFGIVAIESNTIMVGNFSDGFCRSDTGGLYFYSKE
jgi:hypothetical protein